MFCILVVLVKLSVLAKWLARKTPLEKLNRGKVIVSTKPRLKSVYDFIVCFVVWLCASCRLALRDIFHTAMARYSLFVLKVPLDTNKLSNCTLPSLLLFFMIKSCDWQTDEACWTGLSMSLSMSIVYLYSAESYSVSTLPVYWLIWKMVWTCWTKRW